MILVDDFMADGGYEKDIAGTVVYIETTLGWSPLWMADLWEVYEMFSTLWDGAPGSGSKLRQDAIKFIRENWIVQNVKNRVYIDEQNDIIFFEHTADALLWKVTHE